MDERSKLLEAAIRDLIVEDEGDLVTDWVIVSAIHQADGRSTLAIHWPDYMPRWRVNGLLAAGTLDWDEG